MPKTPETINSIINSTTIPMEPTLSSTITQDNSLETIYHNLPTTQNAKEISKKRTNITTIFQAIPWKITTTCTTNHGIPKSTIGIFLTKM